jgi:hypothetical protein
VTALHCCESLESREGAVTRGPLLGSEKSMRGWFFLLILLGSNLLVRHPHCCSDSAALNRAKA